MRMKKNVNLLKNQWNYLKISDLFNMTKTNKKPRKINQKNQNKKSQKKPKLKNHNNMKNQYLSNLKNLSLIKIGNHVFSPILKDKE